MRQKMEPLKVAFALYSRIPVKDCSWEEKARAGALYYFPLVGLPLAVLEFGMLRLMQALGLDLLLCGAAALALPLFYTGGIHLDGFCDVVDARSSHASRERMLEIMKDPHCGAFAVTAAGAYLLVTFALWAQLSQNSAVSACVCLGFVLSRSLSALCALGLPPARKDGMLRALTQPQPAQPKRGKAALVGCALLCAIGMVWLSPAAGCGGVLGAGIALFHYRRMALSEFGGVTGDLAGWFLQVCEVAIAAGAVMVPGIWEGLQCIW